MKSSPKFPGDPGSQILTKIRCLRLVQTCVNRMRLHSKKENFLTGCVFCMHKKQPRLKVTFYVVRLKEPKAPNICKANPSTHQCANEHCDPCSFCSGESDDFSSRNLKRKIHSKQCLIIFQIF